MKPLLVLDESKLSRRERYVLSLAGFDIKFPEFDVYAKPENDSTRQVPSDKKLEETR